MRFITALGIAAVATTAAVAFIGPSTAMAESSTALCKFNEKPCASAAKRFAGVHAVPIKDVKWKVGMFTVTCLSSLMEGSIEGATLREAGESLALKFDFLTWSNCGTSTPHTNCEVANLVLPLFDILYLPALGWGTVEDLKWEIKLNCGILLPSCIYGELEPFVWDNPADPLAHGGYFQIEGQMNKKAGGMLCPAVAKWTGYYDSLESIWVTL